jgi:hypothetical protein
VIVVAGPPGICVTIVDVTVAGAVVMVEPLRSVVVTNTGSDAVTVPGIVITVEPAASVVVSCIGKDWVSVVVGVGVIGVVGGS